MRICGGSDCCTDQFCNLIGSSKVTWGFPVVLAKRKSCQHVRLDTGTHSPSWSLTMGVSRLFCDGLTKGKASRKVSLPVSQRFCYSVGHVLNDLAGNAWFSYLLVFLTKIAGLPNAHAGYVLLISQVFEGICTPVAGILCDRTVCKYGRRKSWHLLGTTCVTISFPFIFNRCLGCTDSSNAVKFFYYTGFSMAFGFGWGSTQIGHLSLIPEISKRVSERVELNALRWV